MIIHRGSFRTKVVYEDLLERHRRLATGENDVTPDEDDIVFIRTNSGCQEKYPGEGGDNCIAIESLAQMRKIFRLQTTLTSLTALVFWGLLIWQSWTTAMSYFREGMVWYRFLPLGFFIILAVLYTAQAFNPVVHDSTGKWVHLRTGSTNLHGGCSIHPKRRKRK